jgi:WD40 repeat protein
MKFPNKESFEEKYKEICTKLKDDTQLKYKEMILKIEEIINALINFKNLYENNFKQELIKSVKILKLYKLFYLNYYYEKNSYKESRDINYLRYIFSFPKEISSINIITNRGVFRELENIKTSINLLKLGDSSFKTQLNFTKIKKGYKIEQIIEKSHDKLLNGIFEISGNKILTGSLDFSMKIWQEVNNKFENIKKIKGQCGAICSMAKLSNGNIVTTAANNNNINIWSKSDKDDNFIINQSLSSHTKPVLTIAELQSGKLLSGGWDNLIIIWDRDINGSYLEKQRIKDKTPITKIISLDINKFAFTSENRIRIMIQKNLKENLPQKNEEQNNENKKGIFDDIFDDLDFNQDVEYDKDEENDFIICFQLTKHIGRVRAMLQLKCGYLLSGSGEMGKKKESIIIVWRPNDLDGFYYVQSLHGHKSDINGLIELKDGRIASSSKDRTIRIWKRFNTIDKNNHNVINFEVNEILSEYPHGIYGLIQLDDGRIVSSTNEFSLIVWKDNKFLSYC